MLKSCKGTGRASLPGSPPSKAACHAALGPRVQRLADTVDEFQLDCKSDLKFHEWSFRLVTPQDHQQAGKCEANYCFAAWGTISGRAMRTGTSIRWIPTW